MKLTRLFKHDFLNFLFANERDAGVEAIALPEEFANADEGKWITANGRHILIKDGENVEDVLSRDKGDDDKDEHGKNVPSLVTVRDPSGRAFNLKVEHDGEGWVVKNKEGQAVPGKKFSSRGAAKKWTEEHFTKEVARRYHDEVAKGTRKGPEMKSEVTERQDKVRRESAETAKGQEDFQRRFGNELGFANQIALADGAAPEWVEVPFGNHDHKHGMQVFDRDAAERIVANFNLQRSPFFGGLPWYVGHPDVPEFANTYKDKTAQGWVKEMEATGTALRLRVKWNKRGEGIIANEEFKYFSPVWGCAPVPGKTRHFRPVRMKSVGFTNEPNIGVLPLSNANEATNQPTTIMEPKELAALLGLDPETATQESITAALTARNETLAANEKAAADAAALILANEQAAATALAAERTAREAAETALANEKTARETADTAFANERKERIDLVLADAIRAGRITEAQRAPWANELAAHFDTKVAELANLKPAIHTSARTKNLGSRKETSDAAAKVVELANERMTQNGEDWTTAYRLTLKAHPALAAQMQSQPAKA